MRLKVLLVDDEPLPRQGLRMLLTDDPHIAAVLEARNGPEAVELITRQEPDLVLLDIQMPQMDGFQVIEAVGVEKMPAVIFVTAFDRYALRAFEVNAIDYLLKPVREDRLRSALDRMKRLTNEPAGEASGRMLAMLETIANPRRYVKRLAIRQSARTIFINVEDVEWLEAAENYVQLHVGEKCHLLHVPFSTLESALDPDHFVRVHRSLIVNVQRIKSLAPAVHGQYLVVLQSGVQLQSGRSYGEAVRSLMANRF